MINILEYLESTALKYPQKQAVIDETSVCTYYDLLTHSRKIGSGLLNKINPRTPVPVLMEKSINTLATFFGIVNAGCFYISLNPELPCSRLSQIKAVTEAPFIITDYEHKEKALEFFDEQSLLFIEDLLTSDIDFDGLKERRENMLDLDPLYANFTSGSTGVPKGVIVSHRSVIDFINVFDKIFNINETDIIANQAPFDFDVSVKDIYSAIKTGATLVLIPKRLFSNPTGLLDYICENKITTMIWAVSALCLISTFHGLDYKVPDTVTKILFSGEVMPQKHLKNWMEHLPHTMFVNLYGPTEITCNCTYHIIDKDTVYEKSIPIGKAFPNEEIILLDNENKKITSPNLNGEICVRGTALALGYYNAPEQTSKSFIQNPLNTKFNELIYRTGDLGYYDNNKELYFAGRKDFQIKYMGHRIELEEIEKAISEMTDIERSCCIFDEEKSKLYGFYVGSVDKKELHKALRESLPVFMVPGMLVKVDEFPLTRNGKIDRKALRLLLGGK